MTKTPTTQDLRCMLVQHMQNMLVDPKQVDVDYGSNLLDRLLQEAELRGAREAYWSVRYEGVIGVKPLDTAIEQIDAQLQQLQKEEDGTT